MRLGEGGGNGRRLWWVKGLIWGDMWGFFGGGRRGERVEGGERTYRLCRTLRRLLEGEG